MGLGEGTRVLYEALRAPWTVHCREEGFLLSIPRPQQLPSLSGQPPALPLLFIPLL